MPLDDIQIERYSRQLVLPEIGPRGHARLASARVAVTASGPAAERVVAYLAAAGVGTLMLAPGLAAVVDPAQTDVRVEALAAAGIAPVDAVVGDGEPAAGPVAAHVFWVADGRAAEAPPCRACAVTALGAGDVTPDELIHVRDAVLGTVVATEIVKALVGIGTPLRGSVLGYDAATATLTRTAVVAIATCPICPST